MESGIISDTQITSSSDLSGKSTAIYARFNQPGEDTNGVEGTWIAATNDRNQWVEVKLYRQTVITGVNMQGNPSSDKWVTRYKVEFSLNNTVWEYVPDENGMVEVSLKALSILICMWSFKLWYMTFINGEESGDIRECYSLMRMVCFFHKLP